MKIQLNGIQETLLIPLIAGADETKRRHPRIKDPNAVKMVRNIDYDLSKFSSAQSNQGVIARTMILDKETVDYINTFPDAVCVSIGCGLDTRYQRISHNKTRWYYLDFPEVVALRKQLLYEGKNVHYIAKTALDSAWCEDIP